jgi:hypothetical protein
MPQEDWELSSGLREDVIFDIHLATCGFRANYNNGATMLIILVGNDENQEPFEHILSVGADWMSPDGRHIQHPGGKNKVNKSSRYGQWILACQAIEPLWNYLTNSAGPTDVSIWENLRIHLHMVPKTQTIRGEVTTRDILEPVEFLGFLPTGAAAPVIPQPQTFAPVVNPQGIVGGVPAGNAPIAVNPPQQVPLQPLMQPATPAPVPPVAVGPTPEQMLQQAQMAAGVATAGSPLRDQLYNLARATPDHASFVGQAFALPGVVTDQPLVKELMDQNDFYAKARV